MEDTPRVVALAIGFAAVLVLRAAMAGAFARFDRAELVALGICGVGFVVLTLVVDPGLRAIARSALESFKVLRRGDVAVGEVAERAG